MSIFCHEYELKSSLTLIERRCVRPVDPRVRQDDGLGPVLHDARKISALEETLVEFHLKHVVQARVDVYPPT
jgi:hypothetical protein